MDDSEDLERWVERALVPTGDPTWVLIEHGYDPRREAGLEARFTVSNGFLGVRGSRAVSRGPIWISWLQGLSWASWPRTYVAGLFDTPNTVPPVPALVPAPDWLRVRLSIDGEPVLMRTGELLEHNRTLDMKRGLVLSDWHQRDTLGHTVRLRTLRFVSLAERALAMQVLELTIDGGRAEVNLEAFLEMAGSGLETVTLDRDLALWRTALSRKVLAMANAAEVKLGDRVLPPETIEPLRRSWVWTSSPGEKAIFSRLVAFARGEASEGDGPLRVASDVLQRARQTRWRRVQETHEQAWAARWSLSDAEIEGDEEAQRALRFAIYHLNSAANPHDERVSVGARALTGDAYLGHVFWDTEIYLLPFYTFNWPQAARALLMYRYHTLAGARAKAQRMGYRGALYAWESADTGEETTPEHIIDPNGRYIDVLCGTQEQHISADIAYAVWQYWQATHDHDFLLNAGAEILLETARFWASRAVLEDDKHYHIRGVIGPDEYHETIDDNAYTNVMAAWNIERGLEVVQLLRERWPERWQALAQALDLVPAELDAWRQVAQHLVVGFDPKTGLFEQFAGYFGLEDIDVSQYEGRTAPMDVVLGRERTQASQVLKQADVVALMALLPETFTPEVQAANFQYYEPRCGHGSSLSRGLHAVVAARLGDVDMAERYFRSTAMTDLSPMTAGSAGGVRIAAQGALWQAAIFGCAGFRQRADGLVVDPHLPPSWRSLAFRVCWRQRQVRIRVLQEPRTVEATLEQGEPLKLYVGAQGQELTAGRGLRIAW